MAPGTESLTNILSFLTVLGGIGSIFLLVAIIQKSFGTSGGILKSILELAATYALHFSFLIALTATASSLFYSEITGFAPCVLCWWQRIFLYPQTVLLGIALAKKDGRITDYILSLSVVGALIALYHSYIQFGGSPLIPCAATAGAVSCAQRYFLQYGYVTIPTMSLTGFVIIILLMCARKAVRTEK